MTKTLHILAGAAALSSAAAANAMMVDLTHPMTSATINNALYETVDFRGAGTGVLEPFVRIQANGFEQGYNTSNNHPAFDEKTGSWTHDMRLGDVPFRIIGGDTYFEFLLDINQSGSNSLLSLEQVQIYTTGTPSQNTPNVPSLGTLRYDMDSGGDNYVLLDANLSSGSGTGDLRLLVPSSAFAGTTANDYVILFSSFGTHNPANSGFEEWAIVAGSVPSPGPMALMAIGGILAFRRKR